jgi:hypothetical protein
MFEIKSVGPLYQIVKSIKINRNRKRQSTEEPSSKKKENENEPPNETVDQHIDEIV